MDRTEDLDTLAARLARARRRLASSTNGGPEWDAAMDEVEDLETRIRALVGEGPGAVPPPMSAGHLQVVA